MTGYCVLSIVDAVYAAYRAYSTTLRSSIVDSYDGGLSTIVTIFDDPSPRVRLLSIAASGIVLHVPGIRSSQERLRSLINPHDGPKTRDLGPACIQHLSFDISRIP